MTFEYSGDLINLTFVYQQELGASQSAYSLRHQLKPNPDFNDVQSNGKIIKNVTFEGIEKVIKKMRTDWGVSNQQNH